MEKSRSTSKKKTKTNAPRQLKRAKLYDALRYQYLPKKDNNGAFGIKCLICRKIFAYCRISSLKSHRNVCGKDIITGTESIALL